MKLREFNPENSISIRGGNDQRPTISVNTKSGLFTFSQAAVSLLGVKNNSQVKFLQDEEDPESWFIHEVKTDGFELRAKTNITKGLIFNNTFLARAIAQSVGMKAQSGKIIVSAKPITEGKKGLWALITAGLKERYSYPE